MARTEKQPHGGTLVKAEKGDVLNPSGRPKGSRNRSTLIRQILELELDLDAVNPVDAEAMRKLGFTTNNEVEYLLDFVQVLKALRGDTAAYSAIKDTLYGKQKQEIGLQNEITVTWEEMPEPEWWRPAGQPSAEAEHAS